MRMEFDIYRIRILQSNQKSLFEDKTRQSLLEEIVEEMPSNSPSTGYRWIIGNVETLDGAGYYFRVGRVTKKAIETYQNGLFVDQDFDSAPYTHVVLDTALEVCAIGHKSSLSPSTRTIANKIVRMFEKSTVNRGAEFMIDSVKNPSDFLQALSEAFEVMRFTFDFSLPNHFDADNLIVKPLQSTLEAVNGKSGRVILSGNELNAENIEQIARSVAASGDEATAKLVVNKDSKPTNRKLSGDLAKIEETEIESLDNKQNLLKKLRIMYHKIRDGVLRNE